MKLDLDGHHTPTTRTVIVTHVEVQTATVIFTEAPTTTTTTTNRTTVARRCLWPVVARGEILRVAWQHRPCTAADCGADLVRERGDGRWGVLVGEYGCGTAVW